MLPVRGEREREREKRRDMQRTLDGMLNQTPPPPSISTNLPLFLPPGGILKESLSYIYKKKGTTERRRRREREREERTEMRSLCTLYRVVLRNSSSCAPWLGLRVSGLKGHATCYLIFQAGTDRRYFAHKQSYVRVTFEDL